MTTPERTRAIRMPRSRPETTIDRALARRWGGARSPTSGSTVKIVNDTQLAISIGVFLLNCGVTVVKEVRKVRKIKTGNESVMQRPILGDTASGQ